MEQNLYICGKISQLIMKKNIFILLCCSFSAIYGQATRFSGDYPLATPAANIIEQKADYEKTLTAIIGGARLAVLKETPTGKSDPEAITRQEFKQSLEEMLAYASELSAAMQNKQEESLKKVSKLLKADKTQDAVQILKSNGGSDGEQAEQVFFIWKDYLQEQKNKAAWLVPSNLAANRLNRAVLNYVGQNFERPFGLYAELGAVVAEAAQALSNCLDYHEKLSWQGEGNINMKKEDDLRRLAACVSYFEWRLHDATNGRRSAKIDKTIVQHLQKALFEVILTMQQDKTDWYKSPLHGANLQILYADAAKIGWNVDGEKAQKYGEKQNTTEEKTIIRAFGW